MSSKAYSPITLIAAACIILGAQTKTYAENPAPVLSPNDRKAIVKLLGPDVVGDAVPSKPIDDPSTLFPFHNNASSYRFTSGKNVGKRQAETLTRVERPGGRAAWRLEMTPSLVGFVKQTTDGDIVMSAVADTGEGALVVTEPANPFLPKGMKPGETRSYSQQVSVRYLDDLSNECYSGILKSDYTYVGTFRVKVPAGTFDAVLMRSRVDGKIGPAHTRGTSYSLFAPGIGLIAMILQQKITAFWIYNVDGAGGKILLSK